VNLLRQPLLLSVFALLLAACGDDDQQRMAGRDRHARPVELMLTDYGRPDPAVLAEEQELYRDNGEEPQTLDPHLAEGLASAHILRDLFEGLTAESPDGRIIPGAAIRCRRNRADRDRSMDPRDCDLSTSEIRHSRFRQQLIQ